MLITCDYLQIPHVAAERPSDITHPNFVPVLPQRATSVAPSHTSSTAKLSAQDAVLPETVVTPSPTLNGHVDNRLKLPIIYLSGPMHGSKKRPDDREVSCDVARMYAKRLWKYGYGVFSPQGNSDFMYGVMDTPDRYMEFDLKVVRELADCIFMLPGWSMADGAIAEKAEAEAKGIPVMYTLVEAYEWITGVR